MVEGSTRRLPTWSTAVDEDKKTKKKELSASSPANSGTQSFLLQDKKAPRVGNKRKAKNVVYGTQPSLDDDDEALTVEDLVAIAQEYVKDNKDLEQNLPSSRICEQSSSNEQRLPCGGSTLNLTSEQSFVNSSRTGDPAQDMLHLFLGPLLKKPQEDEKRTGFASRSEIEKQISE